MGDRTPKWWEGLERPPGPSPHTGGHAASRAALRRAARRPCRLLRQSSSSSDRRDHQVCQSRLELVDASAGAPAHDLYTRDAARLDHRAELQRRRSTIRDHGCSSRALSANDSREHRLLDLAHGVSWQLVDDDDALRNLIARQPVTRQRAQSISVEVTSDRATTTATTRSPRSGSGTADDCRLADPGQGSPARTRRQPGRHSVHRR